MKGILLLNGEPFNEKIISTADTYTICCDGAFSWAKDKIKIDKLIGDFDSLDKLPTNIEIEKFQIEKNFTDGEMGLEELLNMKVSQIDIYGGGGKRIDHFLGNIQLIYRAYKQNVPCFLHTEQSRMYVGSGKIEFVDLKDKCISLLPLFEKAHIIESKGLKYPLLDLTLNAGECRGISNIVISDYATINCVSGIVLIVENKFI